MSVIRRRSVFSGRVQGVGFRATTRELARGFVVTGLVRNEPDGTVLIEVQGEEQELSLFFARLSTTMARNISAQDHCVVPLVEGEREFVIRR